MDELSMLLSSGASNSKIREYVSNLMMEVENSARADERARIERAVLNSMGMAHHTQR